MSEEKNWFICEGREKAGGGKFCHKDWYGCTLEDDYRYYGHKCPKEKNDK